MSLRRTPRYETTLHTHEREPRHVDVPRRRRWRSLEQKPRFLLQARWAGQDARIQRLTGPLALPRRGDLRGPVVIFQRLDRDRGLDVPYTRQGQNPIVGHGDDFFQRREQADRENVVAAESDD